MSRDDAIRDRVKAAKGPKQKRKTWEPITVEQMTRGVTVTAFDQSLSATGWVTAVVSWPRRLHVLSRGTMRPEKPVAGGHYGSILKALALADMLRTTDPRPWGAVTVAEQTPIAGYRLESSLLAGYVVAAQYPQTIFVGRQHALSLVLPPDQRYEKKHTKQIVDRYVYEDHPVGLSWNEHQRDALLLAIAHLYDLEQQ